MNESTREAGRRAGWRAWLLGAGVVLAVSGAGGALWMRDAASELRRRLAACEEQRSDWMDGVAPRPPVRGVGRPGAALARYAEVAGLVGARDDDGLRVPLGPCIQAPPRELARIAAALRAGAECATAGSSAEMKGFVKRMFAPHGGVHRLRVAVAWSARYDEQEGCALQAVERWLDLAWFAGDLARCADAWYPFMFVDEVLRELARYAEGHGVRARVRAALRGLDASLPSLEGWLLTLETRQIRNVLDVPGRRVSRLEQARLLINQPVYTFDMLRAADAFAAQFRAHDRTWPEVRRAAARIRAGQVGAAFFGIERAADHALYWFESHRRVVARLRLLLAALDGAASPGIDPFGDGSQPLRVRREPGRLVVWSVGPDGDDDGGCVPGDEDGFVHRVRERPDIVFVARQQPDPVSPR